MPVKQMLTWSVWVYLSLPAFADQAAELAGSDTSTEVGDSEDGSCEKRGLGHLMCGSQLETR